MNPASRPRGLHSPRLPMALLLGSLLFLPGCATLASMAALAQVRFALGNVTHLRLAGVDLLQVRGYEDLSALDAIRLGSAVAQGVLPLEVGMDVDATNPEGNPEARLAALDWNLFLEGRETVGGRVADNLRLPPGATTPVPILARLDLLEFFDGSARDLVNLAAGLAGVGGEPVALRVEAMPTVETALGPVRYPRPLVLEGRAGGQPR
jgi:hypothetical protein